MKGSIISFFIVIIMGWHQYSICQEMATGDPQAIALAEQVIEANGGKEGWENTNVIDWNFFGSRRLIWDKKREHVRIDMVDGSMTGILDLKTMDCKLSLNGEEQSNPDTLAKYAERLRRIWINDSYWLVFPFKLLDQGVNLEYLGTGKTEKGEDCDMIGLTFAGVGVTPDNKYKVWIDQDDHFVRQWAFFRNASDEEPAFISQFENYIRLGDIYLAQARGDRNFGDVKVYNKVPKSVFKELNPPQIN